MSAKQMRKVREAIREHLAADFRDQFDIEIYTEWNIIAMRAVTRRVDERKFTKEQFSFIAGYEKAYEAACNQVGRQGA